MGDGPTGLLKVAQEKYAAGGRKACWEWAMQPKGPHGKAKRFAALVRFARIKRNQATGASKKSWEDARRQYAHERDKYEAKYEEQHPDADWPDDIEIAECLYHAPGPHFHLASPNREKLIVIGHIGQDLFNCRIGEFPPFDTTEDVHVHCSSWHYRDPSRPFTPVCFSAVHMKLGGDWGCALDANDNDGGNDDDYAFFIEVKRRYL